SIHWLRVAAPPATVMGPTIVCGNVTQGNGEEVCDAALENDAAVVNAIRKLTSGFVSAQYADTIAELATWRPRTRSSDVGGIGWVAMSTPTPLFAVTEVG